MPTSFELFEIIVSPLLQKKVFKLVRKSMTLFVKRLGYTSKGLPVEIMVKCNNKDQWHAIKNKHQIAVFCDQLLRRVNWQHNFSISSSARLCRNHEKKRNCTSLHCKYAADTTYSRNSKWNNPYQVIDGCRRILRRCCQRRWTSWLPWLWKEEQKLH